MKLDDAPDKWPDPDVRNMRGYSREPETSEAAEWPETDVQRPHEQRHTSMQKALAMLDGEVGRLIGTLNPILAPERPEPMEGSPMKEPKMPDTSSIQSQHDSYLQSIQRITAVVAATVRRVDL